MILNAVDKYNILKQNIKEKSEKKIEQGSQEAESVFQNSMKNALGGVLDYVDFT